MANVIIEMKDGTKHVNDPALGSNLAFVAELEEFFRQARFYRLFYLNNGALAVEIVYSDEVANVYEEDEKHG